MKTSVLALALLAAATAPAAAFDYKATVTQCHETQEKWIERETRGGEKILERQDFGAFMSLKVRWDSGTVQEVTVGPHGDRFCTLATRHVSSPAQS